MRFSLGAGVGLGAASLPHSVLAANTQAQQKSGRTAKHVIMLWMGGGPTQYETWDPKTGKNGGEFKPIDTTAPGMRFSENMKVCASQGKNISVIRSMATMEGAHERGTALMHLGQMAIQGLQIPVLGTIISYEKGDKKFPLPHFVAMDPPGVPNFQDSPFGDDYRPFRLADHNNPIPNIRRGVDANRDKDRASILLEQNKEFGEKRKQEVLKTVESAYQKSEDIMNTPLLKAFNYNEEPGELRSQYGDRFGISCLLARRLVEAGCSFVEIGLGGWDMHNDVFGSCKRMLPTLDKGLGTLIKDLAQKDLLKETLVMWLGEFGRTPDINGGNGRDHWANGWSSMLAGGGIQGGRVHGDTGPSGSGCAKPVSAYDYFATIYRACGIDPNKKYDTEGRKIKYLAKDGKVVADLF
jgi:hypothetical protein